LLRLRPDVHIHVAYDDTTPFGSPVGERPDCSVRRIYVPVLEFAELHGYAALAEGRSLLAQVTGSALFSELTEPDRAGAWRIKADFLFPNPGQALPHKITVMREDVDRQAQVGLPLDYWPRAHDLIAALCGAGVDDERAKLGPGTRSILELMKREDMVAPVTCTTEPDIHLVKAELTFVGHNTVVVQSRTTAVVVDPLLFAGGMAFHEHYQPLQVHELGRIDAILLTHSHLDHFDSASLLRLPSGIRVIIPRIERETLLSVHLERRLRDLGFSNITAVDWWQSTLVGDIEVHALPLYGEQPTDSDVVHPTIRNAGNTYLLRAPSFAVAFLADSGRDGRGDVRDVVGRARAKFGPVDVLFSGYRGWFMYPVQHLFSSVARYMLFVPPWLWGVRQQLMTTASGAVDLAERWGARYLVPYADGGAPWHWRIGLGPRLDSEAAEIRGFDPYGGALTSPVSVLVLRPGDSLTDIRLDAAVVSVPDHTWPYDEQVVPPIADEW
jgi:L-ascorbate metabolism protein UlaG (beta-lactamase superfamily)